MDAGFNAVVPAGRVVHCWADKQSWAEETFGYLSPEHCETFVANATCLLPDGHDGPHEWTPDDEVVISFPPAEPA